VDREQEQRHRTRGGVIEVRSVTGGGIGPFLPDLARLRITVFRDWPYLYDGDPAYEQTYLATYAASPESLFVLALDRERVIGASTGIPLNDETESVKAPFRAAGMDERAVFYFGESVLLREYRGRGLGHRFFDAREHYAGELGRFDWTAFCAVVRDPADPRRPRDYRGNEAFWTKRGYERRPDMVAQIAWKEIGESVTSEKPLSFWLRRLAR
jgi:GNAT superfamily N-acetyltransferase